MLIRNLAYICTFTYTPFATDTDVFQLLSDCLMAIKNNQAEMLRRLTPQEPQVLPWAHGPGGEEPSTSGMQHFLAPVRALSVCTDDEIDYLWKISSNLEEEFLSGSSQPLPHTISPSQPRLLSPTIGAFGSESPEPHIISPSPLRLVSPPLAGFMSRSPQLKLSHRPHQD